MNPAGKLAIIMEMYEKGLLCTCNNYKEHREENSQDHTILIEELIHDDDCKAKKAMVDLLNG